MQTQMTPYKEFVISTLEYLLKKKQFRDNYKKVGFSKIIQELVRQYPEINGAGKKTWQKLDLYKIHHKWSVNAANLLKEKQNITYKDFHYEHIVPVSVLIERLMSIHPIIQEEIYKILKDAEVVIITKEEQHYLDRGMKSQGTRSERELFARIEYDKKFINNTL